MKRHVLFVLLSIVCMAATPARASPCGGAPSGFSDVPSGAIFCTDALWLRNAQVTSGCGAGTTYCPNDPVTRAQMALFMRRLVDAVGDRVDFTEEISFSGTDLDTSGVQMCTGPLISIPATGIGSLGRYSHAHGVISFRTNAPADVQVRLTRSDNGGPFQTENDVIPNVSVAGGQWAIATVMTGKQNRLEEGSTTQFRLELFRALGSATAGEITDVRCQLKVWRTHSFG